MDENVSGCFFFWTQCTRCLLWTDTSRYRERRL